VSVVLHQKINKKGRAGQGRAEIEIFFVGFLEELKARKNSFQIS
jgi:hypothetical protein